MGVYLSEPETKKDIHTGTLKNMKFCSGEMQGIEGMTQVGEKTWRTQQSIDLTLVMEMDFLQSSMGMEVK